MDFYEIGVRAGKNNVLEVYPDFIVDRSKDLMTRGNDFYAVWDEDTEMWSKDVLTIRKIVDRDIREKVNQLKENMLEQGKSVVGCYLRKNSSKKWGEFDLYLKRMPDSYKRLDEKVAFQNSRLKKTDYVSKRLPYSLQDGEAPAWEELISTLYEPEEREKIEWAIGAILAGEAKKIQKFLVFYGSQGSGKGTILKIVMKLFEGYYTTFKAENLVQGNDQFNLDFLSEDPLVAIDMDTNLSRIESNALLNILVSHEPLKVNEKFKGRYPVQPICMLMLGTNKPVKITDAKSGIIRRLIDVEPSGRKIKPESRYDALNEQVEFELGAIAKHCLDVYKERGKAYYSDYVPERMMYRTDPFFNFMEEKSDVFLRNEGVSGADLWAMWQDYCKTSGVDYTRKRFEVIDEAKNYFDDFQKCTHVNGKAVRSWFSGLKMEKFRFEEKKPRSDRLKKTETTEESEEGNSKDFEVVGSGWLLMNQTKSLLDDILADCPAQYEVVHPVKGVKPDVSWSKVKTKLKDLDTTRTHYVRGPGQLIFIDFDKHGPDGKKDLKLNLEAAGSDRWKPTYAELSNSGAGIHSYYWYDGNVNDLQSIFEDEIEVKVFPEDQLRSMRRRVTRCNDLPIAHISSGLPLKEKKAMINWDGVKDDRHLRNMILQALKKEIRPYGEEPKTVTCVKYISEVLQDAQKQGISYDLHDLEEAIYAFAAHSHNNKDECVRMFYNMELIWPKEEKPTGNILDDQHSKEAPIIILDCEVVKNLTLVEYKEVEPDGIAAVYKPEDQRKKVVKLFNPKPIEIEQLISQTRIVGHNTTGYDNFILYAIWLGYTPEQIFQVSQDIIVNGNRAPWREAKNISYTDTYDVSSDKKGLKRIELEMHLPHKEMEIDWSKPLPEKEWGRLAEYCENDVLATEAYFLSKSWQADFKARKILAALTGLSVNDSTNNQSAQLIFGNIKEPWHDFIYPDLKKKFPLYRFENGKSYYGDVLIGEGGRVYAEPGTYYNVITFDVAGMHPTSEIVENGFGKHTKMYEDLYNARIAIKHKDYDAARKMFDGRLAPYLESDEDADDLSHALKIVLNSVYGMTAAHFQNRFRDPRNKDNWVAKRGALFMECLRREVQARGGHVIHIKTDSIKLVEPTQELQDFVVNFGKEYGYTFEVESKYERICLVNHAVYIALRQKDDPSWLKECRKAKAKAEKENKEYVEPTRWTATGAQFAHPFVFKHLFSREEKTFWDYCEIKTVKTALYLDMNEKLPDVTQAEKEKAKIQTRIKALNKKLHNSDEALSELDIEKIQAELDDLAKDIAALDEEIVTGHAYSFVGKAGEFMPIRPGLGGGLLMRKETDGSYSYATGAKGYRWMESESLQPIKDWKRYIDIRYFAGLVDVAIDTINKYGDFTIFVQGEDGVVNPDEKITDYNIEPWILPCKSELYAFCSDCPKFISDENGNRCENGFDVSNQLVNQKDEIKI